MGRITPSAGTKGAFSSFRLSWLSRMVSQTMVTVQVSWPGSVSVFPGMVVILYWDPRPVSEWSFSSTAVTTPPMAMARISRTMIRLAVFFLFMCCLPILFAYLPGGISGPKADAGQYIVGSAHRPTPVPAAPVHPLPGAGFYFFFRLPMTMPSPKNAAAVITNVQPGIPDTA